MTELLCAEAPKRFDYQYLKVEAASWLCIAPGLWFNVSPHLRAFWAAGDPNSLAMAAAMSVTVMLLSRIPFLLATTPRISWFPLIGLAVMLGGINITNQARIADHMRSADTHIARAAIDDSGRLEKAIADAKKTRDLMPAFQPVSEEEVADARRAVDRNMRAQEIECASGFGSRCKSIQEQAGTLESSLKILSSRRTMTVQAAALDAEIANKTGELAKIGPKPRHIDGPSAMWAAVFGTTEELIIKWEPAVQAVIWELCTLFGPWMVRWKAGNAAGELSAKKTANKPKPPSSKKSTSGAEAPARRKTGPSELELASVKAWFEAAIVRSGKASEVQAADMRSSYEAWCKETGTLCVTPQRLGRVLKGELAVKFRRDRNKTTHYQGVSLSKKALKLVVSR
jgi:hypothetical protein